MPRAPKLEIDAKYLDEFDKELRKRLTVARSLSAVLKEKEGGTIKVNGTAMLDRSYKYIDTFLLSCKKELGEL